MTPGIGAMLLGAFVVPAVLLWMGHRLRRRSAAWRAVFWGAVAGHLVVIPIVLVAAIYPAEEWEPTDALRGALGFWLLLAGPVLGAAIGALVGGRARRR